MNNRVIFSQNLRILCKNYDSIANVCSGIEINRQQFNKYLAGKCLPSATSMRRICNFFNVQEYALFQNEILHIERPPTSDTRHVLLTPMIELLKNLHSDASHLNAGSYNCYFPVPNVSGMFLRSLIIVRNSNNFKTFVRFTVFPDSNKCPKFIARGKHKGIVLSNGSEIYLLGTNQYAPNQLSMMTIDKSNNIGNGVLSGVALTRSGRGLIGTPFCLERIHEKLHWREMIRSLGFLHESDASIVPYLLSALKQTL